MDDGLVIRDARVKAVLFVMDEILTLVSRGEITEATSDRVDDLAAIVRTIRREDGQDVDSQ